MDQVGIPEQPGRSPETAERDPLSAPSPSPEGAASPSFVYALGKVEPRFPGLAVEKEFAQAVGRADSSGKTDRQALRSVLSDRSNRYLARQVCWVFTIAGVETYILVPRDPADLELLTEAIRPEPRATDLDVVIGMRGPVAPVAVCNGLALPIVAFDQLYSFPRDELIDAIPRPAKTSEEDDEQFRATADELFDRMIQVADNAGATDEHRALNYLAVRYPAIYARAAEAHRGESSLAEVEVHVSRLSGPRNIVDVVFTYLHRRTDVADRYFVRVDVTDEFPFLVTKLSPYYTR